MTKPKTDQMANSTSVCHDSWEKTKAQNINPKGAMTCTAR